MSKVFIVDGKLKEIVTNPDGTRTVRSYQLQSGVIQLIADPKMSLMAQNLVRLAKRLDDDTGLTATDYEELMMGA